MDGPQDKPRHGVAGMCWSFSGQTAALIGETPAEWQLLEIAGQGGSMDDRNESGRGTSTGARGPNCG